MAKILASLVLWAAPAQAHDPTGSWVDLNGNKVKVTRSGRELTLLIQGPRGYTTCHGTIAPSEETFEYQVAGVTYQGRLYGRTITVNSPERYISTWKRVYTPIEGPEAIRHDPTGTWRTTRGVDLNIRTKGEQILVECIDLDGNVFRGKGRWTSTNGFEFGLEGFKGKVTCVIDWWRGGAKPGKGEFQITTRSRMGVEVYTRLSDPGDVE